MIVRTAKLEELHADPSNARSHDERNLNAIADSLKAFGQVEPLVVQKSSGKVIGGNGRLEVMRRQGVTECSIRALALGRPIEHEVSSLREFYTRFPAQVPPAMGDGSRGDAP